MKIMIKINNGEFINLSTPNIFYNLHNGFNMFNGDWIFSKHTRNVLYSIEDIIFVKSFYEHRTI